MPKTRYTVFPRALHELVHGCRQIGAAFNEGRGSRRVDGIGEHAQRHVREIVKSEFAFVADDLGCESTAPSLQRLNTDEPKLAGESLEAGQGIRKPGQQTKVVLEDDDGRPEVDTASPHRAVTRVASDLPGQWRTPSIDLVQRELRCHEVPLGFRISFDSIEEMEPQPSGRHFGSHMRTARPRRTQTDHKNLHAALHALANALDGGTR